MASRPTTLIGWMDHARRSICVAVLLAACPWLVGCYGRFPLTRAVYRLNGDIGGDVLKNVVFWAFVIFPVYGGAALIDALAFNLVEFWSGTEITIASATDGNGTVLALAPSADGREALLTARQPDGTTTQVHFVRVSDTLCEARDDSGAVLGTACLTACGDLALADAQGRVVRTIPGQDLAVLRAQ